MSALQDQIGGSHYRDMPIQPIQFVLANKLGGGEALVLKYISRADGDSSTCRQGWCND